MINLDSFSSFFVANWKLNGSLGFIDGYFELLNTVKTVSSTCGIICPPSLYLNECNLKLNSTLHLGAQDCSNYKTGPYTGEISAEMLSDNNCHFCIIGHSERRQKFSINNEDVKIKAQNLLNSNINPIICIGETFEQKKSGITKEVLNKQLRESMPTNASENSVIIAYEPIWAIGSGLIPTYVEINNIHSFLKKDLIQYENFKIIYGGSVKYDNAKEIMNLVNVDGLLVGGASLDPVEFIKILNV